MPQVKRQLFTQPIANICMLGFDFVPNTEAKLGGIDRLDVEALTVSSSFGIFYRYMLLKLLYIMF
jgi:hypothetical protein